MKIEKSDGDNTGERERIERLLKGLDFLDDVPLDPDVLPRKPNAVEDVSEELAVMENAARIINEYPFLKDLWMEQVATLPTDLLTNMCHMLPILIEHAERAAAEPSKDIEIGRQAGKFFKPYLPPTNHPTREDVSRILNRLWKLSFQTLIQLRQPKIGTTSEVDQLLDEFFDKDR